VFRGDRIFFHSSSFFVTPPKKKKTKKRAPFASRTPKKKFTSVGVVAEIIWESAKDLGSGAIVWVGGRLELQLGLLWQQVNWSYGTQEKRS